MRTSDRGIEFIKQWEGFAAQPYIDAVGIETIGYGHVIRQGENFPQGLYEEEATQLLIRDLERFETHVLRNVEVPISQSQFDALVSFCYNVGTGNFDKSTLKRKLNDYDYDGAADEFQRWNRAGGKVLTGLHRRRHAEAEMFLSEAV